MTEVHPSRPLLAVILAAALLVGILAGVIGTLATTTEKQITTTNPTTGGCLPMAAKLTIPTTVSDRPDADPSLTDHIVLLNGKEIGTMKTDQPSDVQILRQTGCNAYLTVVPDGIGGYINYDVSALAFYSISLKDGTLTKIATGNASVTDISADESMIVGTSVFDGTSGSTVTLTVTNLKTRQAKQYPVSGDWGAGGDATFSPDGTKVAFSVALNNPDAEASQVMILALATGKVMPFGDQVIGSVAHVHGWLNNDLPRVN